MKNISGLFTKIYQDIINDRVSLPHLPDIAIKLRKAIAGNNYTIDTLARVILTDANVCAYLLNIVNSPIYKTRAEATDIQAVIRIMGVSSVRNLVTVYALRSMANSQNHFMKKHLNIHWKKSAYQAAIAHALAKKFQGIDTERALLAGLLQSVGGLPVLMKIEESMQEVPTDEEVDTALDAYSGKVGNLLAQKWGLDEELQLVIKNRGNLAYSSGDEIDLVDVVNIARLLSQIGSHNIHWPKIEETPCLQKYNSEGLTLKDSLLLLKEARDDINRVKKFLTG